MLTLPIKKKWFELILSGEKTEEYREIKPYYTVRFRNCGLFSGKKVRIRFRNGYGANSPSFIADCTLGTGCGKPEWGAVSDIKYYILYIGDIE